MLNFSKDNTELLPEHQQSRGSQAPTILFTQFPVPTGKGFQDAEPQTYASPVPGAPADRPQLHLSQVKSSSTGQCAENKDSVLSSKRDIDI